MEVKLYVANLSPAATEQGLQELFSQAGSVTAVHLLASQANGEPRAVAHVTMATQAEAQKAIDRFHESTQWGQPLMVNPARPRAVPTENQGRLGAFGPGKSGGKGNPRRPGQGRP